MSLVRAQLLFAKSAALLLGAGSLLLSEPQVLASATDSAAETAYGVTNVAQFRLVSGADYLLGCNFHLTGVVTLVDTDRDLVVLQDETGAVAVSCPGELRALEVGQRATLDGTNCCPLFASFPDFPYRPSGSDVCDSFEAPGNWGEYNLTRMRGFLHPQMTGDYRFWIASDNSSELWLSTDSNPANARKIAYVPRFDWTDPHQWKKFPSQGSELINLKAGETYYIEALQEQTEAGENLSVAWQDAAPGNTNILVIEGEYLTPWKGSRISPETATGGILREYWTNYFDGDVDGMAGARVFRSALSVDHVGVRIHGKAELPHPVRIALNEPLAPENDYRWVLVEGLVKFRATKGNEATLEVSDGKTRIPVQALHWSEELSKQLTALTNAVAQIQGVCRGVTDPQGTFVPGMIVASAPGGICFTEAGTTNEFTTNVSEPAPATVTSEPAIQGFLGTLGVVTFNHRVFGKDYIFIQEGDSPLLVSLNNSLLKDQLKIGNYVDLGGKLERGKYLARITPFFVTVLGWRAMPSPISLPAGPFGHGQANLEGRWAEMEGVVHTANTNDTLLIMGKSGPAFLWLDQTYTNDLSRYVDAKLRARGVLMTTLMDAPLLLVPSHDFIDVEEEPPTDPFNAPRRLVAALGPETKDYAYAHRVRVIGQVTYNADDSFFLQDASGGIRVQKTSPQLKLPIGAWVELVAFPKLFGSTALLTEPLVRSTAAEEEIRPRELDLSEALPSKQSCSLVQVSATLLARRTNGSNLTLELQEQQRVFTAILTTNQGNLPEIAPGSRLRITGVRDEDMTVAPLPEERSPKSQFVTSLSLLLRTPRDVVLLNGPSWWTWKKAAVLVGMLLTILAMALLWVQLLRRRLGRQQAFQLAFSQHVFKRLEEERRRIAVNLHDSLGQTLLVIKNHAILATQSPSEEEEIQNRLEKISGATSQAIEEVRRITHGLRPYQLDRLGLTQAIRTSIGQASANSSILFASRVDMIDGLFDKDAEIHVYRIVQEAITNVVKHSGATEATVVVKNRESAVSLSIRDNGRGFDSTNLSSQSHDVGYGLTGITERVRMLNGTFTIDSRPGLGTSLTVELRLHVFNHSNEHEK